MADSRDLFINLPVDDPAAAKAFFAKLGLAFNATFSNDDCACMVLNERAYVMLLKKAFFKSFTPRDVCDGASQVETLLAFSVSSRDAVDDLLAIAISAGAQEAREPTDHGFMYGRSFFDLDDHQWEIVWMDPARAGASQGQTS